jgi:predicted enzyme related to lactoylglutathione lyase
VKAGGGNVIMGPMDVPGGQRIIVAVDPQGASVGFVSGERQ